MESEPPWKLWYPPAGTTVSVPAAVCRKKETFDEFLANFEEEMDSEEGKRRRRRRMKRWWRTTRCGPGGLCGGGGC